MLFLSLKLNIFIEKFDEYHINCTLRMRDYLVPSYN